MPFTSTQFFDVFRAYNESVWPAQVLWVLVALGAIGMIASKRAQDGRLIGFFLAALWCWAGAAYHLGFFAAINHAALAFGTLFVLEGMLLAWWSVRHRPMYRIRPTGAGVAGALLTAYALLGYPLIAVIAGQRYPAVPTFGVPCPIVIFTFGLLLWTEMPVPRLLLVIPAAWALVGTSAAVTLGVGEDYGLLVAGVLGTTLLVRRDVRKARMVDTRRGAEAGTPRPASSSAAHRR